MGNIELKKEIVDLYDALGDGKLEESKKKLIHQRLARLNEEAFEKWEVNPRAISVDKEFFLLQAADNYAEIGDREKAVELLRKSYDRNVESPMPKGYVTSEIINEMRKLGLTEEAKISEVKLRNRYNELMRGETKGDFMEKEYGIFNKGIKIAKKKEKGLAKKLAIAASFFVLAGVFVMSFGSLTGQVTSSVSRGGSAIGSIVSLFAIIGAYYFVRKEVLTR